MGSPIFDSTFGTGRFENRERLQQIREEWMSKLKDKDASGRFENRELKEKSMTNLEALRKVWNMANHSIDLGGRPWMAEEKEALRKAKQFIELIEDGETDRPALQESDK